MARQSASIMRRVQWRDSRLRRIGADRRKRVKTIELHLIEARKWT
jgi:hypothetical protein